MRRALSGLPIALLLAVAQPATATFHLWQINEIYTSPDGSVQFIELFTSSTGQQFTNGEQIIASQGTSSETFTFPSNTPTPTTNRHLLIGNSAFQALGCAATDFTLVTPFLFGPGGTVDFVGADSVTYTALPSDGILSLAGNGTTTATNSPTNFAGSTCTLDLSGSPQGSGVPALSSWGFATFAGCLLAAACWSLKRSRGASR
jgi:hypothetical protein